MRTHDCNQNQHHEDDNMVMNGMETNNEEVWTPVMAAMVKMAWR